MRSLIPFLTLSLSATEGARVLLGVGDTNCWPAQLGAVDVGGGAAAGVRGLEVVPGCSGAVDTGVRGRLPGRMPDTGVWEREDARGRPDNGATDGGIRSAGIALVDEIVSEWLGPSDAAGEG